MSMHVVVDKFYVECYTFEHYAEFIDFFSACEVSRKIYIEQSSGDEFCAYIGRSSLNDDLVFAIGLRRYRHRKNVFMSWWNAGYVVGGGDLLFLLTDDLNVIGLYRIDAPIVGLAVIGEKRRLLLLDEMGVRIINADGALLFEKALEFIRNVDIVDGTLIIDTDSGCVSLRFDDAI